MDIKYNQFGEVVSVDGLTTGHHIGTPMQDALGTQAENSNYYVANATVTNCENTIVDKQPEPQGGSSSDVGGGILIVNHTAKDENYCQLDKTFDEIKTAFESGMLPILVDNGMVAYLNTINDNTIQFMNNNAEHYNIDSNNEATCYEHQGMWGGDW